LWIKFEVILFLFEIAKSGSPVAKSTVERGKSKEQLNDVNHKEEEKGNTRMGIEARN
jgi:hypothetical protein